MHVSIQLQNFAIKMKILHIESKVKVDRRKSAIWIFFCRSSYEYLLRDHLTL